MVSRELQTTHSHLIIKQETHKLISLLLLVNLIMALSLPKPTQAARPSPISLGMSLTGLPLKPIHDLHLPLTPPLDSEGFCAQDFGAVYSKTLDQYSKPLVAVIGVGYVGLHLVESFSRAFDTLGFDISEQRIQDVKSSFADNPRVKLTTSRKALGEATHYLIAVPTLLLPDRSIDSSYLRSALETVGEHARPGSTIVIESSVAIGMTRELLGPLAKSRGYFAGMSPEVCVIRGPAPSEKKADRFRM